MKKNEELKEREKAAVSSKQWQLAVGRQAIGIARKKQRCFVSLCVVLRVTLW